MHNKSRLSIAGVFLILLGAYSNALAGPLRPCDALTQQVASAIYGAPVQAGAEQDFGIVHNCNFLAPGGHEGFFLAFYDEENAAAAARAFKIGMAAQQATPGVTTEPIPGLGESAYYYKTAADSGNVIIVYHGTLIALGASGSTNPGFKAAMLQATKQVLGELSP